MGLGFTINRKKRFDTNVITINLQLFNLNSLLISNNLIFND